MPQVEIISELERESAWEFQAQVLDDSGGLHRRVMTLSWADYNLWSRTGADQPAHVADAVLTFLLGRLALHELPERFDASMARRRFVDADRTIPQLIQA